MATAELAVALPSLVLVLALALAALDLGIAQVRCVDAARVGARLLARGEPAGPVLAEVRAAGPRAHGWRSGRLDGTGHGDRPGRSRLLAPLEGSSVPSVAVARSRPAARRRP